MNFRPRSRWTATSCRVSASRRSFHKPWACTAWAVISGVLRSKGRVPQPRQKVGTPPSRFCRFNEPDRTFFHGGQHGLFLLLRGAEVPESCRRAPLVSSASGTPPGRSVQAHAPGAALVKG